MIVEYIRYRIPQGEVRSFEDADRAAAASLKASPHCERYELGEDFVLELKDGRSLRGDRLLVATGRRPRVEGIGLETGGIEPDPRGIPVDGQLRAGEGLWAIGDVTGIPGAGRGRRQRVPGVNRRREPGPLNRIPQTR